MNSRPSRPAEVIALRRRVLDEVTADLERSRVSGTESAHVRARRAFFHALEDYEAALAAVGAPLPRRLRLKLELYRALGSAR